jgi:hypothetical protein
VAIAIKQIHQLYLAYLGRPADPAGTSFYLDNPAWTLHSAAQAFEAAAESAYEASSGAAYVDEIYRNLFNRGAEAAGSAYWLGEVAAGRVSLAFLPMAILLGAQGQDAACVQNKLKIMAAFANEIDTQPERNGYSGATSIGFSSAFLATITHEEATMEAAYDNLLYEVALACGLLVDPPCLRRPRRRPRRRPLLPRLPRSPRCRPTRRRCHQAPG